MTKQKMILMAVFVLCLAYTGLAFVDIEGSLGLLESYHNEVQQQAIKEIADPLRALITAHDQMAGGLVLAIFTFLGLWRAYRAGRLIARDGKTILLDQTVRNITQALCVPIVMVAVSAAITSSNPSGCLNSVAFHPYVCSDARVTEDGSFQYWATWVNLFWEPFKLAYFLPVMTVIALIMAAPVFPAVIVLMSVWLLMMDMMIATYYRIRDVPVRWR